MAVVSCTLLHTGRGLEIGEEEAFSYSLEYQVRTNNPRDDAREVLDGYLVAGPDPGPDWMANYIRSSGAVDTASFARRFTCTQPREDSPTLWHVRVGFVPMPRGLPPTYTAAPIQPAFVGTPPTFPLAPGSVGAPPAGQYSPLSEPPRYWIEQRTVTRIVEEDRDGNPIVNSAGGPFDEPVEEEYELETFVFRFRTTSPAAVRALNRDYARKLNASSYLGYAAEHLLCLPFHMSEREYAAGTSFWTVTVRILANDKPWRREFVNRGFKHYRKGSEAEPELVLATDSTVDSAGVKVALSPVSEPVLLTDGTEEDGPGAGFRLSDYPALPQLGNVRKIATRGTANFSALPFDWAIPA